MKAMLEFIRRLSDRGEFVLVLTISFSYIVIASIAMFALQVRQFDFTTGRVARGLVFEALILGVVAGILRLRGWRAARMGLDFSWRRAIGGVPLFVAYMISYWLIVGFAMSFLRSTTMLDFKFRVTAPFALVLGFIVLNSFFEETLVAGYVVEALSDQGPALAITASTLIRFSYHVYQGPIASLSILPLGLLFCAVYWRWRSVWPLIVAHTIVNVISMSASRA
jgi:membrane protease YdiL (CAAX protease family)